MSVLKWIGLSALASWCAGCAADVEQDEPGANDPAGVVSAREEALTVDYSYMDLRHMNFRDVDLAGSTFKGSTNSHRIRFVGADLRGADLRGTFFRWIDFSYAELGLLALKAARS